MLAANAERAGRVALFPRARATDSDTMKMKNGQVNTFSTCLTCAERQRAFRNFDPAVTVRHMIRLVDSAQNSVGATKRCANRHANSNSNCVTIVICKNLIVQEAQQAHIWLLHIHFPVMNMHALLI